MTGAADTGAPDARLTAALLGYDGSAAAVGEVLAGLSDARVFLALAARALPRVGAGSHASGAAADGAGVAAPEAGPATSAGHRQPAPGPPRQSPAQLSLLNLVAPSGARAMPVFAGGVDVQRWRAEARPVAVSGPLACRTALDDGVDALLLDPQGAAVAIPAEWLTELAHGRVPIVEGLRADPMTAGGQGRLTSQQVPERPMSTGVSGLSSRWGSQPPASSQPVPPSLLQAVSGALAGERLREARLHMGSDGCPVLAVTPMEPQHPAAVAALAARLRRRLGDELPAQGLDLTLAAAGGAGELVPVGAPRLRRRWRRH